MGIRIFRWIDFVFSNMNYIVTASVHTKYNNDPQLHIHLQ